MIWQVVKIIIDRYHEAKLEITNLRLQKILYFIQEQSAKKLGKIAFEEEMQAWIFGPVFPDVYNLYSSYGRDNISNTLETLYDSKESIPKDILEIVDKEIAETKNIQNTWDLVRKTHATGSVWYNITNGGKDIHYQNIPAESLLGK